MGVFAEGPTDPDFFSPLLVRLAIVLIRSGGKHSAGIADPLILPGRPSNDTFAPTIQRYASLCNLIVVHTDGNGDPDGARAERIEPWFGSWPLSEARTALVPVVPVRETEAWMLADIDAIQRLLGTKQDASDLGLPTRVRGVEQIADPKSTLKTILDRALGVRRARKVGVRPLYGALGAETSIDKLRMVPAFARFESEFHATLAALGFISRRSSS